MDTRPGKPALRFLVVHLFHPCQKKRSLSFLVLLFFSLGGGGLTNTSPPLDPQDPVPMAPITLAPAAAGLQLLRPVAGAQAWESIQIFVGEVCFTRLVK